jgi:hypothetical protein
VRPVDGSWGRDAGGAVATAVTDDFVAAVLPGRDLVRITDRAGKEPVDIDGSRFVAPVWGFQDRLWLVDRPGSTRVRVVSDGRARTLPARGLRKLTVTSFALSPDGGRYAVAAGKGGTSSVYVGPVQRDRDDELASLGNPLRLSIGVGDPHSVDWASTTRLGFLGASDAGVQPYEVALDGTDLAGGDTGGGPLLPDVDATVLAARTDEDPARWVLDGRHRLWYLPPGGAWRLVDDRRFSALSTGD